MTATPATSPVATATIERQVRIAAPPETVFPFLTDATRLVQWMGRVATLDARPGGIFRIDYNGFDIVRGEFIEVVAHSKVTFSWGWEAPDASVGPGASRVEVTLTADGDGTIVHVLHSNLPLDDTGHAAGWDHFLPRFVAVASGTEPGVDDWAPRATEVLAGELNGLLRELLAMVDGCSSERWAQARTVEGWTIGAAAAHALGHVSLVELAIAVGAGQVTDIALTMDEVDAKNAADALAFATASKDAIRERVSEAHVKFVEPLRAMPDEHLPTMVTMSALSPQPLTAEHLIRMLVLGGIGSHLASLQAALS